MSKVVAVVVTHNRLHLLRECIDALKCQTRKVDTILVVNNGSTDATMAWLNKQADLEVIHQKNTGSAGGFHTGIEWGSQENYDWIWLMDDDGYPHYKALENLLAADNGELRWLNCAVIDKADKSSFVWDTKGHKTLADVKSNIIEGIGHPFNGTLLHRDIVNKVGLPHPKYFIWGEETEYFYRISNTYKIPVCTVANSIHYHPKANFSIKNEWELDNAWKMYYYVRNRFHIHLAKFSNVASAYLNYFSFLVALYTSVILFQKNDKRKKIRFIAWAVTDAFNHNFTQSPISILNHIKENYLENDTLFEKGGQRLRKHKKEGKILRA